ncbi:hypothetical protein BBP40_004256 [Aspergillus hancockii]|nr:hypothetical protein BBP40_004256 [Aspergillus hancockii]
MAGGNQIQIGSKGLTLSGGQKQRVALARAVFSRQDVALLDVLSALDVRTQDAVIARLFSSNGVFRQLGTTVIMTTHNADNVIKLNAEGRAMSQTANIVNKCEDALRSSSENEEKRKGVPGHKDGDQGNGTSASNYEEISDNDYGPYQADWRSHHISLLFENGWYSSLCRWTKAGGKELPLYLSVYAALALMASLITMNCIWVVFLEIMPNSPIRLHWVLLDAVMRAPLSFFASTDTDVSLNRFSQNMGLVHLALPIALMSVDESFIGCVATVDLIATGSPYMAITIPFTLGVLYALQKVYLKTSHQLRYLDLESKALYILTSSRYSEDCPSLGFSLAEGFYTDTFQALDQSQTPYYMLLCAQRWLNLVLDIVVMALTTIVVALAVELHNNTTAGLLGVALNNLLGFNRPGSNPGTASGSAARLFHALGSVRYNADLTGASNDEDITSVLKQIGVWKVIKSRGGLEAVLEDHPLSQGEQQLSYMARSIIKKRITNPECQVLILDKATSSVDGKTYRRIQQVMRNAFKDSTVISVAHRLDTIIDFDRIAVLDAGRLAEFDTQQNLLVRDSLFRQMYDSDEK